MNSIDWLKSVRENPQKSPVPPVPPEGSRDKNPVKLHNPPETPCNTVYLDEKGKDLTGVEQPEIYWGEEAERPSAGGHRGNQAFDRGNDDPANKVDRGNQGNYELPPPEQQTAKPKRPFFTADGTLSIPFDSDPKYHWWNGGQSVEQTRADVRAWMAAEAVKANG